MNEATAIRLESATRMGQHWAGEPGVIAVLLTGSTVEETCDATSDVDMCVYWATAPTRDMLDAVKAECGSGERFFFFGEPEQGGCVESYPIGGIRHDFAHTTLEIWDAQTADVLEQLNLDSLWPKGMYGTLRGRALHGADVIDGLRGKLAPYPDRLQLALLGKYCQFRAHATIRRYAQERGDLLFYFELLTTLETNLLFTLCAVNRVYHAMEFKRLPRFIEREFAHAPANLAARLDALLTGDVATFPPDLIALVEETLAIVEAQCPEFDTTPVRAKWQLVV